MSRLLLRIREELPERTVLMLTNRSIDPRRFARMRAWPSGAAARLERRACRRSTPKAKGRPELSALANRAKVSWERHTTGRDNVVDAADKNQ